MKKIIKDWDITLSKWEEDCQTVYNQPNRCPNPPKSPIALNSFSSMIKSSPFNIKNYDLQYFEIPEPYSCQFDAEGNVICNAVLINLNPGTSSSTEFLKYYFHGGKPRMTLINDFCNNKIYSDWQSKFNYLNPTPNGIQQLNNDGLKVTDIPGYNWWHQTNRIPYLKRLLENQNKSGINDEITPFIIEMCPFHSKKWGGQFGKNPVYSTQLEMAEKAVGISATSKGLRFAVGIGKEISNFLSATNGYMCFRVEDNVRNNKCFSNKWPVKKNGNPCSRVYEVWEYNDKLVILVTYARGGNKAPDCSFYAVEADIISWMKNNKLI